MVYRNPLTEGASPRRGTWSEVSPSVECLLLEQSGRGPNKFRSCGRGGSLAQLIATVGTVVLGMPPVRIGQHLLAYRLATALCLDAV